MRYEEGRAAFGEKGRASKGELMALAQLVGF
jgi:hypothetical protein